MPTYIFICVSLMLAVCDAHCAVSYRSCVLWDLSSFDTISDNARESVVWYGYKILKQDYVSVTRKQRSFTGDPHNYESTATYYWQDPSNPDGKYILKDGQKNPECDMYCVNLMYELSDNLKKMGEAYYVTGEKKYAIWALEQLKVWFLNAETCMKPDFEYGQVIPGGSYKKGNIGSISEAYYFVNALELIGLLKDNNMLDKNTDRKLKRWFSDFAHWMTTSNIGTKMQAAKDNCGNMYDILLYRIYLYLGNKRACRQLAHSFTENRILAHIDEEGRQVEELKRNNAMTYSIYNLSHILDFCFMLENSGTHYYSENHERIDAAMEFLCMYIGNKEKFPYQEIGDWNKAEKNLKREYERLQKLKSNNLQ